MEKVLNKTQYKSTRMLKNNVMDTVTAGVSVGTIEAIDTVPTGTDTGEMIKISIQLVIGLVTLVKLIISNRRERKANKK